MATTAAAALVGIGTGTTLAATTSAWSSNLLSVDWSGIKRKSLATSNMGTTPNSTTYSSTAAPTNFGSETFIPGVLSDPGSLKVKVQFNPDKIPPIDAAAETWTVTFPKTGTQSTSGDKWAATAFVTDFDVTDALETVMEATMTLKASGAVSFTQGG